MEVRDDTGRVVARLPAPSEEELVERIRRDWAAGVPHFPAEQVERRLQRLEELRRQDGMDEARMRDLLRRMRAGEDV